MDAARALQRFSELVQADESEVALWEVVSLLAAQAHPALDLARVDDGFARMAQRIAEAGLGADPFAGLARAFVQRERFAGNHADYADPENSYLDSVLARRLGIPISLSVVMIELGARLGIEVEGIGLPTHFVVRDGIRRDRWFDPFSGELLDEAGLAALFRRLSPASVEFGPHSAPRYGPRAIVARMLRNLEAGPCARDMVVSAWLVRLHAAIPGLPPNERLNLAQRAGAVADHEVAAEQYMRVAEVVGDDDAARLRAMAGRARARWN